MRISDSLEYSLIFFNQLLQMLVISWLELALLFLMGKFMKSKSFVFFPSRFQNILMFYVVLLVVMVFFCMISFKKLLIGLVYWKFFCICLIIFCSDSWWQLISTCLTERYLTPTAYWGGGLLLFFFLVMWACQMCMSYSESG